MLFHVKSKNFESADYLIKSLAHIREARLLNPLAADCAALAALVIKFPY